MREGNALGRKGVRPLEVPVVTSEALGLIMSGPLTQLATDGRHVMLSGPSVPAGWPKPTPSEAAAYADGRPVIDLWADELLRVATGGVLDTQTRRGEPARVRLYTTVELMVANRRARGDLGPEEFPPPMSREQAAELVAPVVISAREHEQLLEKFGLPDHMERWRRQMNRKRRA